MKLNDVYKMGSTSTSIISLIFRCDKEMSKLLKEVYLDINNNHNVKSKRDNAKLDKTINDIIIYLNTGIITNEIIDIDLDISKGKLDMSNIYLKTILIALFRVIPLTTALRLLRHTSSTKDEFINAVNNINKNGYFKYCSYSIIYSDNISELNVEKKLPASNKIINRLTDDKFLKLFYDFNHIKENKSDDLSNKIKDIAFKVTLNSNVEMTTREIRELVKECEYSCNFLSYKPMLEYDREKLMYSHIVIKMFINITNWKYWNYREIFEFIDLVLDNEVDSSIIDNVKEIVKLTFGLFEISKKHCNVAYILRGLMGPEFMYDLIKIELFKRIKNDRNKHSSKIINDMLNELLNDDMRNIVTDYDILFTPTNSFSILQSNEGDMRLMLSDTMNSFLNYINNNSDLLKHVNEYLKKCIDKDTGNVEFDIDNLHYIKCIVDRSSFIDELKN